MGVEKIETEEKNWMKTKENLFLFFQNLIQIVIMPYDILINMGIQIYYTLELYFLWSSLYKGEGGFICGLKGFFHM